MVDDEHDRDSGPFCSHWVEGGGCDERCMCGHTCEQHDFWSQSCDVPDCTCEHFSDLKTSEEL